MRADQKQTIAVNRVSRRRGAVETDISSDSPVKKIGGDSFKNNSAQKITIKSSEKLLKIREINEPRTVTPTPNTASADREGKIKDTSTCFSSNNKLSSSTPRRKRDLLANLYSDLSPKYIGFSTPPSSTAAGNNGSESDGGLQTRSARRRKLLTYAESPDLAGSDSEVLADTSTTLIGCVRRTRNESVTPSPNRLSARKKFESPIDKLLARNGSVVLNDISKEKIVKSLDVNAEPKLNTINNKNQPDSKVEYIETNCDKPNTDLLVVAEAQESSQTMCVKIDKNTSDPKEEAVEEADIEDVEDNQVGCSEINLDIENQAVSSEETFAETGNEVESNVIHAVQNEIVINAGTSPKENNREEDKEITNIPEASQISEENFLSNPVVVVKIENDSFENIAECNSEIAENHTDSADAILQYDLEGGESGESMILNNAVGLSAKSPSAVSLDSAKGSSVVTGMAWMSFTTGDLFWGQIYTYCYWPCIVCPDPNGKTITTEHNARNNEEYVLVHVRFFADSGRRNWVKRENLIPYTDLENYKQHMREVRKKYGKKSAKYKLLLPKPSKVMIWREAIKEANKVAEVLYEDRLKKFFEMYEHKKSLQKLQRKQRKLSNDNGSSISSFRHDSMESLIVKNPLAAGKRDRSASPYSPAFSPLKSVTSIKRRKLSDASNKELKALENVGEDNSDVLENSKNVSTTQTLDGDANMSSSFTSLHGVELSNSDEYRNFYHAMKDFVLEDNKDDILERSLIVAARNIWALRQINRQQMQRRLLSVSNEQELGSSLVEIGSNQGTVKRLSNRLRIMRYRHSLPAKIKVPPTIEILESPQNGDQVVQSVEKPKRPLNRPIEEVIDDIFNLDSKYLFRGLARDPVCKYCLHPGGQLVRCAKGCLSWLHADCIGKVPNIGKKPKSNGRRKSESSKSRRDSVKGPFETKTLLEKQIFADFHQERAGTSLSLPSYHVTADADADADVEPDTDISIVEKAPDVICDTCALGKPPVCAVCKSDNSSESNREELVTCNMPHCSKAFHPSCCRYWPQAKFTKSKNKIESFRCPSHVCHTCVSDDPKGKFQHLSNSKLTKCVKCPASYHMDSTCIPAGSQILTAAHIICPRHNDSGKSDGHVNVNWCFICVGGGQVICCETCPTAVHAKCLNIPLDPSEGYICEECESGRLPLYGEMVWAKFNSFRWWPAIILPPTEIPQNIRRKAHNSNDFVVRFFGTHDHGWISRRRVYLYLEGDSSEPPKTKSSLDQSYNRGVEEAKRIYEIIKSKKLAQRLSNESKEKLHPQPYVRIKANRAVHPVKLHIDLDKVNRCECKTDDIDPCGPYSNCLNRVLYHECNPKVCPAGERCQNQMFESRLSPRLDVVYLKERGFGLVCREPISAGDFVIEYVGEIIDDNEFRQRMSQKSLDRDENFYFLSVEKDYIIDAGPKGNLARFMNHSCDPNCETQKWSVNGLNRIGLFAIKDIPADAELTFNYHWDDLLGNEKKICLCGAAKCVGEIGGKNKEEKVPKENPALDVSKAKSSASRKRKPLKRLQNRARDGDEKKQGKSRANTVNVKSRAKSVKANASTKLAEQQKPVDTGNDASVKYNNLTDDTDTTANDDENGKSTNSILI